MQSTTDQLSWLNSPAKPISDAHIQAAQERQQSLTKPPGSLGKLESIAIDFAGWQALTIPKLQTIRIVVFAADHGIAQHGVSAFPQEVTAQMIANFDRGGAAITVLARSLGADFRVVDLGTVGAIAASPRVVSKQLGPGTSDFSATAAMTESQLCSALFAGKEQIDQDLDLFIGGEMGIANTTSASALSCALLDRTADSLTGRGTGVNDETLERKILLVNKALRLHNCAQRSAIENLQRVGGFEIAALVGAYVAAAQQGIPILVDGFICTAAALCACHINPSVRQWMLFSHQSEEAGHAQLLASLNAQPILQLGMRLGEASGAALAAHLVRQALLLHEQMATFTDAAVSDGSGV